tara:strand:+ start:264 stop:1397 length:1134 start_codon:yes stop_codon:yes gene_type:complete
MDEFLNKYGLDGGKFERMKIGVFNNISYWGIRSSVLKSGICKYFRRKEWDKFEWCIVEMFILGLKSKGIFTNLVNRLKILLMEEIVCLEIGGIVEGIRLLYSLDDKDDDERLICLIQFSRLVRLMKRGRVVSYVNNWCRFKGIIINFDDIELNKVKKYKKKDDSIELLKLGEIFIDFLEKKDFKLIEIENLVYDLDGKFGNRYRRKDGIYLLVEILEDMFGENEILKEVIDFGKNMLFRKNMKERRAFGVWLMMIVWKFDDLIFHKFEIDSLNDEEIITYMKQRKNIVFDDYVINDYHVNKKHGLKKFGEVGSLVIDEDLDILEEKGIEMKQFYIQIKSLDQEKVKKKKFIKKKIIKKNKKKEEKDDEKKEEKELEN